MIGEKLAAVYSKLENGFYSILDFIDSKGIPVYSVIDPIEERGIPAFPLFIALIVIIVSAFFAFSVVGTGIAPTFQFSIVDEQGNSLSGVVVSIYNAKGEKIADSITAGDNVSYKMQEKIPAGEQIRIVGRKDGYKEAEQVIPKLTEENIQVSLMLEKVGGMVSGSIRFYDEISGTPIPYVDAIVLYDDESIERVSDNNGEISLGAVPAGKELLLKAFADGYEDYEEGILFESTYTKSVFMTPESIALEGESLLTITVIDKETKEFIDGARVQVYDNETSALLIDKIIEAGVFSELVPKGTVVRIVAEKEGYVKYDSLDEEKVLTIRAEHEDWGKVELSKGGELLQVNVIDSESEMPLIGAEVTLFNSRGEVIDSGITEFGGFVEFRDLNANSTYFIGGQAEGYLPTKMEFIPKARKSIDLKLDRMTSSNSGMLIVHVIDSRRQEANNTTLKFFELEEERMTPLGIKPQETSIDGSYSLKVKLGKNVYVEAIKGLEKGDGNKVIESGTNDLLIELDLSKTVKLLRLKDENGNYLQEGRIIIRSSDGLTLFDGNIEEGEILFDTLGNKYLEIEVTTPDGRKYTEQVTVGDEEEIEIHVKPISFSELNPEINFIEVRDLEGEKVEGLTKGKEYVLVFETKWIDGRYKGGVHVRVGPDNIKYADSQYVGIVGFDAVTKNYFYGRTYSQKNEGIDYSNKGKSGAYNKFLELYLDNPAGNKIIKVKVKVRETFNGETVQVHFRAWSNMNGKYYRTPEDAELGENEFNELKAGLYAETLTKDIRVFEAEPICSEEVCSSYLFLDEAMRDYGRTEFFAVKDKVYALQFELSSEASATATVNASTSKENPKIAFTGKEIEVFSDTFIDNESSETTIQFKQSIPRDATKKARIYFKAKELGQAVIKTQVIAGKSVLEESFYFRVYEEEEMLFTIEPSVISIGKDFLITLKSKKGEAITNADIKFFDSRGIMVEKIIGKDAPGKGKNGRYEVKNNFDAGKYTVEITSPRYKPVKTEIFIGREDGIKVDEEIMVDILHGEESRIIFSPVRNETTADLTNVSIELKYPINFPKELSLTAVIPAFIPKNEGTQIELSATYTGVKDELSHGEAEAIITGYAEGSYPIRAKTRIIVNYNRKLDPNCLKFDRPELKEYLIGVEGNSKQMELKIKNECGVPLTLIPEFIPRGEGDEGIEFSFGEIKLREGEERIVKINVMNKIRRAFEKQKEVEYDLFLHSNQLSKSIPIKVILWDEKFSLEVTPQIVIYMTQTQRGMKATAFRDIFIRNTAYADIENLNIGVDSKADWQQLGMQILPKQDVAVLKKGMALTPPFRVVFESDSEKNFLVNGKLLVNGRIEGREYLLRAIDVYVHVSAGFGCLEIWTEESLDFISRDVKTGFIERKLRITNHCLEPVEIRGIEGERIGDNRFSINPTSMQLMPRQSAELTLTLHKRQGSTWKGETKLRLNALALKSLREIKSQDITAYLELGETTISCGSGPQGTCLVRGKQEIDVCEPGEGTKEVYFPKMAENENCSEGYCDSVQLSKFLAEKIVEQIRQAKRGIATASHSSLQLGGKCRANEGYCSFGALGVLSRSFEVFMVNDKLGKHVFDRVVREGKYDELQNPFVREMDAAELGPIVRGGFSGRTVILPTKFEGCGRYTARINGAVQVYGTEIVPENMAIHVELEKERETTPECENRVQNVMNFIPIDDGLEYGTREETWLGLIQSNNEMKPITEDFSEGLFGTKERVVSSPANNYIKFAFGETGTEKVKIAIDKSGAAGAPKTVNVFINPNYKETEEEDIKKNIASDAGKIIRSLKNGVIEKGCISPEEDYLLISSTSDLVEEADLKFEPSGLNTIKLYVGKENCIDFNVSSRLKTKMKLKYSFEETRGVTSVGFKNEKDDKELKQELVLNENEFKKEEKRYKRNFMLCVTGNKEMTDAQGAPIEMYIENTETKRTVKINVCGIHPLDLMERANDWKRDGRLKPEDKPYYATVGWDNDKDSYPLGDIKRTLAKKRPEYNEDAKLKEAIRVKTPVGLGIYLGACSAGSLGWALIPGVGWAKWFGNVLLDCIAPAGMGALHYSGLFPKITAVPGEFLGDVSAAFKSLWADVSGGEAESPEERTVKNTQRKKEGAPPDITGGSTPSDLETYKTILGTAAVTGALRTIISPIIVERKKLYKTAEELQRAVESGKVDPATVKYAQGGKTGIKELGEELGAITSELEEKRKALNYLNNTKGLKQAHMTDQGLKFYKTAPNGRLGEWKPTAKVEENVRERLRTVFGDDYQKVFSDKSSVKDKWIKQASGEGGLNQRYAQFAEKIDKSVANTYEGGKLRAQTAEGLQSLEKGKIDNDLVKNLKGQLESEESFKKAIVGEKGVEKATKELTKKPWARALFSSLGRSITSQFLGWAAWKIYWNNANLPLESQLTNAGIKKVGGETTYDPGMEFEKFETYEVSVVKKEGGGEEIHYRKIDPEKIDASLINSRRMDDCDGQFLKKKIDIAPKPSDKSDEDQESLEGPEEAPACEVDGEETETSFKDKVEKTWPQCAFIADATEKYVESYGLEEDGVNPEFAISIAKQESDCDPNAKGEGGKRTWQLTGQLAIKGEKIGTPEGDTKVAIGLMDTCATIGRRGGLSGGELSDGIAYCYHRGPGNLQNATKKMSEGKSFRVAALEACYEWYDGGANCAGLSREECCNGEKGYGVNYPDAVKRWYRELC